MERASNSDSRPRPARRALVSRTVVLGAGALMIGAMFQGGAGRLDFDGDSFPDTLPLGQLRLHLFSTPRSPDGKEATRPIGGNFEQVLRQALATNDFVVEFLDRSDASELMTVRRFAEEIVGDAPTDREKVKRLLEWMAASWDFGVELSTVNAAELLARRQGVCETAGFVVGVLDALGIKAREVTNAPVSQLPGIAVEAWLDGGWRVAHFLSKPPHLDDRSMLEILAGRERNVAVVYYWVDPADPKKRLLRTKVWYEPRLDPIFRTTRGLEPAQMPRSLADLRISY